MLVTVEVVIYLPIVINLTGNKSGGRRSYCSGRYLPMHIHVAFLKALQLDVR